MTRYYSSTAQPTTLSAACTDVATTIQVAATTGFPAVEFILALDYGASTQELVKVTNVAGTTLTVVRGFDSSSAQAHILGAAVRHVHTADDFRLSRTHEAASSGVHGATGALVGTTDAQALSNKDLSSGTNTFPASLATDAEVTTAVSNHAALTATHGATGAVVGTTNTQTLTNKTIDLTSNTVTMTKAQLNAAVSDADVATIAGTETLAGKTLTSPTLNTPTIVSPTTTNLTLDGVNISAACGSYTPTLTNFTNGTGGTLTGAFTRIGHLVFVSIYVQGGTGASATGAMKISLPATAVARQQALTLQYYDGTELCGVGEITSSATALNVILHNTSGAQAPWNSWAAGRAIVITGVYEAV